MAEETTPETPEEQPAAAATLEEQTAPPLAVGDVIGVPATPADDHPDGNFVDHVVTDIQPDGTPVLEPVQGPTSDTPVAELPPLAPPLPEDVPEEEPLFPIGKPEERRASGDTTALASGSWDGVERRKGKGDRRHPSEDAPPAESTGESAPAPEPPAALPFEPAAPEPKYAELEMGDATTDYVDPDGNKRLALCTDASDENGYRSLVVFYKSHLDFVTE